MTLTAQGFEAVQDAETGAFAGLFSGFTKLNEGVVGLQEQLIEGLAGVFPEGQRALGTAGLEHLFEGANMLPGTAEGTLLALLGANFSPEALNASLLVEADQSSLAAQFGGLEGFAGHNLLLLAGLAHLASGKDVPWDAVGKLTTDMEAFNDDILGAEKSFNSHLVGAEDQIEQAIFGDNSALNGFVNRGFNVFNMLFDSQERTVNGLLGLTDYDPKDLTESLLHGSDQQVFNGGEVGGLLGLLDQGMFQISDLFGLKGADFDGLFQDVDGDALGSGLKDLLTTALLGPFLSFEDGDLTSAFDGIGPVFQDLGAVFAL